MLSNLSDGTYGVKCEFNPGGQQYTYLVDPSQGDINEGCDVVVATPNGGYKVLYVRGRSNDLSPVNLKYMKYIIQVVNMHPYNKLMASLTGETTEPTIDEADQGQSVLDEAKLTPQ